MNSSQHSTARFFPPPTPSLQQKWSDLMAALPMRTTNFPTPGALCNTTLPPTEN